MADERRLLLAECSSGDDSSAPMRGMLNRIAPFEGLKLTTRGQTHGGKIFPFMFTDGRRSLRTGLSNTYSNSSSEIAPLASRNALPGKLKGRFATLLVFKGSG